MSKAVVGGVVVVGVLAVGVIGGSWYTGTQVEAGFRALEGQEFASNSGRVAVKLKALTYDRSLFSAKARTEWSMSFAGEADGVVVAFDHAIKHGPFPSMQLATIHSTLEMPEAVPAEISSVLTTALNGRSLLEADSRIGFDVKSHQTTFASPALDLVFPDNVQVTWGGLNAEWNVKSNGAEHSTLKVPVLAALVPNETISFKLEGLSTMQETAPLDKYPALAKGTGSFSIDRIALENSEEAFSAVVSGIKMASDAHPEDQFMSAGLSLGVDKVVAQGETVENAGFEIRFERIGLEPLNAIAQRFASASMEQVEDEVQQAVMENFNALMKQQPAIEIKRIGFKANQGELNVGARVAYVGEGDLSHGPQPTDIDADLNVAVAQPLLERMLASTAGSRHAAIELFNEDHGEGEPDLEKMAHDFAVSIISQFEQVGLIKAEGGKLALNFQNKKGQMMLNEKPVTPAEIGEMVVNVQQALQGR